MYEALLKATPEYQKIAASFAKPGPAALFGLPPAGRALLYAALQKDLGRVLCIVTPGEAEATHFADDLKALGLAAAVFPPRDFMLRPVEGAGREYEYRRLSVLGSLAGCLLYTSWIPSRNDVSSPSRNTTLQVLPVVLAIAAQSPLPLKALSVQSTAVFVRSRSFSFIVLK